MKPAGRIRIYMAGVAHFFSLVGCTPLGGGTVPGK
jgi:hypothetical protein